MPKIDENFLVMRKTGNLPTNQFGIMHRKLQFKLL